MPEYLEVYEGYDTQSYSLNRYKLVKQHAWESIILN